MAWGRASMIRSVDRLTGRNDCTEAVLAQSRPRWVGVLPAGCLTLGLLSGGSIGIHRALSGALAGIVGALLFGALTSFRILARAGDEILVVRASKLGGDARELLASVPAPFRPAPTTERHQTRLEIEIAGHRLFVSSFVRDRYDYIVGTSAA